MIVESGVQIGPGIQLLSDITPVSYVTSGLQVNLLTAPSSGTTWIDTQGGYNATLQGAPSYVSNNGGGIKLNNATYLGNDYISTPYNSSTNTVTVEVVASFNPTSYWATIWGNETYNGPQGFYAYMSGSTSMVWGVAGSTTTSTITASNSIRHWIWVINGASYSLYLNGSQLGTTYTGTAATSFNTYGYYFGARHQNSGGSPGIDKMNNSTSANYPVFYQMRIYNKALSAAEVTQNYNAVKGTYGI